MVQKIPDLKKITHAVVRMYRMGTGDCFIIKFFTEEVNTFTMMIDCGTWQGSKEHLEKYIINLKEYIRTDRPDQLPTVDLLIVTHEHKDHVYGFDACRELFMNDFAVKKIWMAWTENDTPASADPLSEKVKQWQAEHGQRKKALNAAAKRFNELYTEKNPQKKIKSNSMDEFQFNFANALNQFADLHFSLREGQYVGDLEGMRIVKKEIAKNNITYLRPGQIVENIENAEGIRFYVLGPPTSIEAIKKEGGPAGETFSHSNNNRRADNESFTAAMLNSMEPGSLAGILPFNESYVAASGMKIYNDEPWRQIENDWLNSAGTLALRMNSATNNLSLALAIEFIDSGRVMLFPGDAEFGSWESWHTINWPIESADEKKHVTEELLNRTVFYKVAHHLSHNGTAKRKGVEMMNHKDLVAMATLDYSVISKGWTNTMPNRDLIMDLLNRTKGRLIIMNEEGLSVDQTGVKQPLSIKIAEMRSQLMNNLERESFENALEQDEKNLYMQYKVMANDNLL